MCGIAGYVGHGEAGVLEAMLACLVHRGPDEEGTFEAGRVGLGVRRLRVMDLAHGQQPMADETGRIRVVMNGEIYNHRELRRELEGKGHQFFSQCDTEVVAHLFEEEREGAFERLRGMFAIALWDGEQETLHLVRDPFGIKPLYVASGDQTGVDGPQLWFASELPALLVALPHRRINIQTLLPFFAHLYIPGPSTIYEGITQLSPGEILSVRPNGLYRQRYAQLSLERQPESIIPSAEWHEEWVARIRESVQAHLMSDVPLGLFLSGGMDSGTLLAMMRQEISGPIRTFSIGYESDRDGSYNEVAAAERVARYFETQHHTEWVSPKAVDLLPDILASMGEPFADSSAIPTFLISQVASRTVTVGLSGIGGDELFGGYPRHLGLRLAKYYAGLPRTFRSWMARYAVPWIVEQPDNRNRGGRLRRFLQYGDRPLPEQYVKWTSFIPHEWEGNVFSSHVQELVGDTSRTDEYITLFDAWPSREPEDRAMGLDLQTYLPGDLLRMADRLSMAHSLELRVPFCDLDLLDFAKRVPPSLRFSGYRLKGGMRKALRSVLPDDILARPKYGFQVPLARWLREDLREMVRDVLSCRSVRDQGYLNPDYVQWLIREHESGNRNLTDQLYAVLVFELWVKEHGALVREHRHVRGAFAS